MLAEKTIRKHVSIIHAYSLMSILQRKIVNVLLYEAIKDNSPLNQRNSVAIERHISFSHLCKAIKFNSNNTQYLKESIDELASLKIEWNLLKDKAPTEISFLNLRVLHGAPTFYHDNTINFSFHRVMLDLVNNPSIYGTLDVELQSEFESKYGHALYENSTRFVNLQKSKIIQLDIFRKMLGVQENKYSSMRELTRNVISPSLEEVNDRANFVVHLETVKNGRKIIGFEVSVKNKKKSIAPDNSLGISRNENVQKEIKEAFGILNESILKNILNSYPEEYIQEKITYTKKHAKKSNAGLYPIAYFISAIKYDYKFKDEHQQQENAEKLSDTEIESNNKLSQLQSDLSHWEKLLEYAKKSNNEVQIKNIQNIVVGCQEKLNQYYSDQITQEETI